MTRTKPEVAKEFIDLAIVLFERSYDCRKNGATEESMYLEFDIISAGLVTTATDEWVQKFLRRAVTTAIKCVDSGISLEDGRGQFTIFMITEYNDQRRK
jgi:hypothetical protein